MQTADLNKAMKDWMLDKARQKIYPEIGFSFWHRNIFNETVRIEIVDVLNEGRLYRVKYVDRMTEVGSTTLRNWYRKSLQENLNEIQRQHRRSGNGSGQGSGNYPGS